MDSALATPMDGVTHQQPYGGSMASKTQVAHRRRFSNLPELIVSYQVRDRNRVLKLQRSMGDRGGVSRRVNAVLLACGACQSLDDLVISQTRLRQADFVAMVRFLKKHSRFVGLTLQACLLERMDAVFPLLDHLANEEECHLETVSFTAVEVLNEDCNNNSTRSGSNNSPNNTTTRAYSCMVRALLSQFPSEISALSKLTLRNVDLAGTQDGELLSNFLMKSPYTRALEMYQSILGPLGSQMLCPQLTGPDGLRELYLRYCSLDEANGVADLVRQVGSPESSVVTLGLYRNRSAPALILRLLAHVLQNTGTLQHLILSDSPFLFFSDPAMTNLDDDPSAVQGFLEAVKTNQTLKSLKIVCCGLKSALIGTLVQAVEKKKNFSSLRLRGSRLEEAGLIQLSRSLPQMQRLRKLEIFCSGDGLTKRAIREFCNAANQHASLIEFEGAGWLDHNSQAMLQNFCVRNQLLAKSQAFVKSSPVPLGLWPHALERILFTHIPSSAWSDRHCFGDGADDIKFHYPHDQHYRQPNEINAPECGLSAAFTVIQAIQSVMVESCR